MLPGDKPVLCTRIKVARNLAVTLYSSQFTVLLLPKTWFLLSTSFPVSLFLTCFSLFVCFLPLSFQLLVSSKSQRDTQREGSIRLPYYFSLPLLSSYLTAGWLPLEYITASEIGKLEKYQQKHHVHCIAKPEETILSPHGNSLFS